MSEDHPTPESSEEKSKFPITLVLIVVGLVLVGLALRGERCGGKPKPDGPASIESDATFEGFQCKDGKWVEVWTPVAMF